MMSILKNNKESYRSRSFNKHRQPTKEEATSLNNVVNKKYINI